MIRRDLLKILGVAPLLAPQTGSGNARWFVSSYEQSHRGFELYWYGWIKLYNQHAQVGSWIARNPSKIGWHVYSAYPGATAKEREGYMIDLSIQSDQIIPMPWATEAELEAYKQDAYKRLIKYIDDNYQELTT